MKTAIESIGKSEVLGLVADYAAAIEVPRHLNIEVVCKACCDNIDLAPAKRSKKISSHRDAICSWTQKFYNGFLGRPSHKIGSPPKTTPDPAVNAIIACALPTLSDLDLKRIEYAHRLSMSAENILGPFVEEYVFEKLKNYGWALAWGETVKSVDLCSADGSLIQIKNRSNTENSSSNKVRVGTDIKKWFRVDANTGEYLWDGLCAMAHVPSTTLSEDDFRLYVKSALTNNPRALGVDSGSPWRV